MTVLLSYKRNKEISTYVRGDLTRSAQGHRVYKHRNEIDDKQKK